MPSPLSSNSQSTFIHISPPVESPVDDSLPLPSPRLSSSPRPSTSKVNKKKNDQVLNEILRQGDAQLELMQNLSASFNTFLERQEQTEKEFLGVFKKMADKYLCGGGNYREILHHSFLEHHVPKKN